jgi:hypothetical protein
MTKREIIRLFLAATLGWWATGVAAPPAAEEGRTPGRVTIDIFSGRPNPTFIAAAEDLARVLAMIDRLAMGNDDKGVPSQLGYSGITIVRDDHSIITTYRDAIEIRTWTANPAESTFAYKRDDAKSVEAELLRLAEKSGIVNKGLVAMIAAQKDERRPKGK